MFHFNRSRFTITFVLCWLLVFSALPVRAGDSWFSKARPGVARSEDGRLIAAGRDSALTVFDVTVSLYNDPSGDDDPDHDTGSEDQTTYEEIIRLWADAVCEQSNGAHHLGKVRIFRNGDHSSRADVRWSESIWPQAHVSGFGTSGRHIFFGDEFPGGAAGQDKDMLADLEGSGYTLGHEWGHYVYGLFDEYAGDDPAVTDPGFPQVGDVPTTPSIMHRQWSARGGDFEWLNHSTENNIGDPDDTAQGRVYGKSGWEVLLQDTDDDPKSGQATAQPTRTRFTALAGNEPTAADGWVREELPTDRASCRGDLEIIWMDASTSQLIIDVSGSMSGTPLANAQVAGKNLVEIFPEGNNSALGLVSFDSTPVQQHPITMIPDPGTAHKAAIQASIDALTAGGTTAMYDAAKLGLDNLLTFPGASGSDAASKVVFLLSDGLDNSSTETQATVTASYQAASVPLITFGYGSGAPGGVLRQLAQDTGGEFFSSPTTLAEIQDAFLSANTAVSESVALASGVLPTGVGGTLTESFQVDESLISFMAFVNWEGAVADMALDLLAPGGGSAGLPFDCEQVGAEASCRVDADAAALAALGAGTWAVQARGSSVDETRVTVVALPGEGRTYDIRLASVGGNTVQYPEPMVLTAAIGRELPITGVRVTASIEAPGGQTTVLDMNDDGRAGDAVAGDGIYSVVTGYDRNGVYTVNIGIDNSAAGARFTVEGIQPTHPSPTVDGELPPLPPLPTIDENFTRFARLQLTVEGATLDDHLPSAPGTPLPGGNAGVSGRIDGAGDVDCFAVPAPVPPGDLVVRVTDLALGMIPVLDVYTADGTSLLETVDLSTGQSVNGYLFTTLPADTVSNGVLACVRHDNPDAAGGTYEVSAGPAIVSDDLDVAAPQILDIPTLSQLGLGAMALLLLLSAGWVLRRRAAV